MTRGLLLCAILVVAVPGCGGPPEPAPIAIGTDRCRLCSRPVMNPRLAAQVGVPAESPLFFDDIECLATYLQRRTVLPRYTAAYVTDHRTGEWIPAATAVYTRHLALDTPAGSHLLAHGSVESRDAEIVGRTGSEVPTAQLFPLGAPDGTR